ncbi:MAG: thiamine-phosphate kinase [Hydrogenophilales bacterium 28-61-23]|nr:MAG: thiamine-phosphate kinase [Hydrogenophilales bacterium 28-61-23]
MPSEFDLIQRFFTRSAPNAVLGVGDDAALVQVAPGKLLAVSSDMLVAGRHFLPDADPCLLGHKTLAVNLSDLAAMGATPRWATLALALPGVDEAWLAAFSRGFFELADRFGVTLVGGDTTRGPLNLCVTVFGETLAQPLRRDLAQAGDDIWVSGDLGGAALGLAHLSGDVHLDQDEASACLARLHQPEPRVQLGGLLAELPRVAAIDISDGLLADLGHILERSGVGADIELARLPAHAAVAARLPDSSLARRCLLAGGDDYELCFTASPVSASAILAAGATAGVALSRIGQTSEQPGLRVVGVDGLPLKIEERGFDHFASR